jgi:hypothetical protein
VTPELMFGLILGFFFGFVLASFNTNNSQERKLKKRKDPANWWKYGGDPFDYTDFRD